MPWSPPVTRREVFEAMADGEESVAPQTAALLRRCATDPLVSALVSPEPTWDVPHRLLAGARWLVLAGEAADFEEAPDPYASFRALLEARAEWLRAFVLERQIQTNEPQRCWSLLPLFLTVAAMARRPLDLVELGTSAGLNLFWDRYRYHYMAGTWGGDSPLVLHGEERSPVPGELLEIKVEVSRRRSIDLDPVDATSSDGLRLLDAFVRDDGYRARVRRASGVLSGEPPELIQGDYLEVLPALLEDREATSLTVLFQTHSTVYLSDDRRARLRAIVDAAAKAGPLAWISTPTPEEHGERRGDYPLELAIWPGHSRRIVARTSVRGEWLEWIG